MQKDVRAGECGTQLTVNATYLEYRINLYLFEADDIGIDKSVPLERAFRVSTWVKMEVMQK